LIGAYEAALPTGAWPSWVLGNHDCSRVGSRLGIRQARVAAMLLLTLRGTPTIYQGEEIGMTDVQIAPERVQDPLEKNMPGLGLGRDPARTPLPWDPDPGAGFTAGEPWLPLNDDYRQLNVAAQAADRCSMLSLYRALLELRRALPALSAGAYLPVAATNDVLAYERQYEYRRLLVVLNMGGGAQAFDLVSRSGRVLLSTDCARTDNDVDRVIELRPDEGCIIDIDAGSRRGASGAAI
jgi:alpha-glucosidase